jgi:protein SCO1/2
VSKTIQVMLRSRLAMSLAALSVATLSGLHSPATAQVRNASEPASAGADGQTEPARRSPRYLLLGSHGRAVTSEDFRNRFQLITFGFVSCPDVCPTTLLEMQQVLAALGARAKHLQPLFITVDPQRDTAAVLDAYTRNFDARILGLTGSPELVRRAADAFKVRVEKIQEPGAGADVYTLDHSTGMFLLGPDGQLLAKFSYGTPVPELTGRIQQWLDAEGK